MQMLTDSGAIRHSPQHVSGHILRMGAQETNPPDIRLPIQAPQQLGKSGVFVPIGIHILAEKRYLLNPLLNESMDLVEHRLNRPAPLPSAHVRHDAIRAEIVASAHNRHPRLEPSVPLRRKALIRLRRIRGPCSDPRALTVDQSRQFPIGVRTGHEIHVRMIREEPLSQALGHTSHHAQHEIRLVSFQSAQLTDPPQGSLLRARSHRACVH